MSLLSVKVLYTLILLCLVPFYIVCEVNTKPSSNSNATAFEYIGCYIDGGPGNRLFKDHQKNYPQILTPKKCSQHCYKEGFSYFGTQYSFECFCSNNKPSNEKKSSESECNSKCDGDKSKICGGGNRLSVYHIGSTDLGDDAVLKYVGCFKDYSNGSRLMNGHHQEFPDTLTNQLCTKLCRRRGFVFAGMEYGKECFCDSTNLSFLNYAEDEDCSTRCHGNNLQLCGGNWRISVFETGNSGSPSSSYNAGNYIGCFEDQESQRSLNGHKQDFASNLTPLKCTGLCYSLGFLYAGTQNSKECYCGDKHQDLNLKRKEEECNKPCSGDPIQTCGGDYRNSIRETGIPDFPVHEKYLGCFNDQNNHVLKGYETTLHLTNSPRRCTNLCWKMGFKYSGVEYGEECFCGNEKPNPLSVVSGDECSMVCTGDPLETCGAGWRLAVYATNATATVVPLISKPLPTVDRTCQLSETTVNGEPACKGQVIFQDEFVSPLGKKWNNVVQIADAPDYEFVVFHDSPANCFTSQNQLVITPTVIDDTQTHTGSLQLQGCTGRLGTRECGFQAFSFNILPPVASARINTKHSFAFRYGIVEIKAKLPVGDWLVPELWLEPKHQAYGSNYASGRIRVALIRGNQNLECNGKEFGRRFLESGVVMGPPDDIRSRSINSTVPDNWHDHFHTYTLIWKADRISFKIDNEAEHDIVSPGNYLCEAIGFSNEDCAIWNSGSRIAPFDKEFYMSIGLSAGNSRDFPDGCINNGKPKPWKNLEVKAMLKFWQDKNSWSQTWSDEKSSLYVDHVKVTAL